MRAATLPPCLLLCLLTAAPAAQNVVVGNTAWHGDIVTTKDGLTLPPGEFTVGELIDAVARYLCRNYLYDPQVVADAIGFELHRSVSLDALGSEEVLYALLASRNLAALPLDEPRGIYQIVALERGPNASHPIAMIPWRRPQDILNRPTFRELVLTMVTFEHLDAQQTAGALRNHFAMQRTWQPGAPTVCAAGDHTLMFHGYGDQIAQTLVALREVDRRSAPRADAPPVPLEVLRRLEALEREVVELRRQLAERR